MIALSVSSGQCLKCGQKGNVWQGLCFVCLHACGPETGPSRYEQGAEITKTDTKTVRTSGNKLISEAQLQDAIIELAQRLGWRAHAERPAWSAKGYRTPIQGDAGFPDLVLARLPRLVLIECKSETGRLSPEQQAWKAEFGDENVGIPARAFMFEYYVARPRDWTSGRIEELLR